VPSDGTSTTEEFSNISDIVSEDKPDQAHERLAQLHVQLRQPVRQFAVATGTSWHGKSRSTTATRATPTRRARGVCLAPCWCPHVALHPEHERDGHVLGQKVMMSVHTHLVDDFYPGSSPRSAAVQRHATMFMSNVSRSRPQRTGGTIPSGRRLALRRVVWKSIAHVATRSTSLSCFKGSPVRNC
jgi:hypothetical protein